MKPDEIQPVMKRDYASENTTDSVAAKRAARLAEARQKRLDNAWQDLGETLREMGDEEPEF